MSDKPYAGLIALANVRLSFTSLEKRPMIDKSKPFYIVRTPEFGTGEHYIKLPNGTTRPVPDPYRAVQTLDEAIGHALAASKHGKQWDVFELRRVGSTQPPLAVYVPVEKPKRRKARKAKRKVRR